MNCKSNTAVLVRWLDNIIPSSDRTGFYTALLSTIQGIDLWYTQFSQRHSPKQTRQAILAECPVRATPTRFIPVEFPISA